jgi:hypothetical protein
MMDNGCHELIVTRLSGEIFEIRGEFWSVVVGSG